MYIFEISIFNLHIAPTWYGLTYAIGFIVCYIFVKKYFAFRQSKDIDSLLSYIFFWVILGGRIWYVILYNISYFIDNPMKILAIWEWWMSFHGGFLGTTLAIYIFSRKYKYEFWKLIDTLAIIVPVAIWLWRIGNWINKELPWYYPYDGHYPMILQWVKYFPSPLLEMFLEWICLFLIMILSFIFFKKVKPWFFSWIFLIGYSIARLIAEQYRLPDTHIGYLLWSDWITLGMIYTLPMVLFGIYLISNRYR